MDKFCYSCSAPLNLPEFKGTAEHFCKYCTDEKGNLKSREEIQKGIAQWFQSWQPDLDEKKGNVWNFSYWNLIIVCDLVFVI